MVKGMIDLAHTLGYKVVAEGVETSQEASILHGLKCDYAQGYLYSRPISKVDFEALVN
jgi:EAL domain-containing protein (putative c-di-GMP-specific phosphodiesterase class I)